MQYTLKPWVPIRWELNFFESFSYDFYFTACLLDPKCNNGVTIGNVFRNIDFYKRILRRRKNIKLGNTVKVVDFIYS